MSIFCLFCEKTEYARSASQEKLKRNITSCEAYSSLRENFLNYTWNVWSNQWSRSLLTQFTSWDNELNWEWNHDKIIEIYLFMFWEEI
jgi:hypothetical protein